MSALKITANYILAFLAVVMVSCTSEPAPKKKPAKKSRYESLLQRFEPVKFDTLKVYSDYDNRYGNYRGKPLDSISVTLLGEKNYVRDPEYGYFACYRFRIDKSKTALIVRAPGEYESSQIRLYVYDAAADKIAYQHLISEIWGDAGDSLEILSYLFRENNDSLRALIVEHEEHDPSVDDSLQSVVESKTSYTLLDLSKNRPVVLSKDSLELAGKLEAFEKN